MTEVAHATADLPIHTVASPVVANDLTGIISEYSGVLQQPFAFTADFLTAQS